MIGRILVMHAGAVWGLKRKAKIDFDFLKEKESFVIYLKLNNLICLTLTCRLIWLNARRVVSIASVFAWRKSSIKRGTAGTCCVTFK